MQIDIDSKTDIKVSSLKQMMVPSKNVQRVSNKIITLKPLVTNNINLSLSDSMQQNEIQHSKYNKTKGSRIENEVLENGYYSNPSQTLSINMPNTHSIYAEKTDNSHLPFSFNSTGTGIFKRQRISLDKIFPSCWSSK